ncbi:DeoR family transcriptional regulator, myo-inositol catabolism operon repressor [Evansella caseinilytica]|uniref:DeoR family transcriptional regulator, myo-inositol catabolism operon repressor n=1 Tax=Evansella caseinilytica TaxID=1503961 RepID=A0A1H3SUQ9_9BACI|nr:DeoR/GlpR family DNA-binding transcription regulator [Evansella caseinilytica]SDZ41712.1 DeoR family transcriptional regulator, myo-inositol catabolism operon repressor [Evansella caseinilytica]
MKSQRQDSIVDYVNEHGAVSLEDLAATFHVSLNTIRRDIQGLVSENKIKKVYGGVTTTRSAPVQYDEREVMKEQEKKAIAKHAVTFVEDGDTIFIDSGTTTVFMADYLLNRQVTIITNNLDFIIRSKRSADLRIITTGGILDQATNSFVDFQKNKHLQPYNIDKAFMASTGISLQNGITHASPFENEIKKEALSAAEQSFLLIDHTKFNQHALLTYAPLSAIHHIITDAAPDKQLQAVLKESDVDLTVVNEKE